MIHYLSWDLCLGHCLAKSLTLENFNIQRDCRKVTPKHKLEPFPGSKSHSEGMEVFRKGSLKVKKKAALTPAHHSIPPIPLPKVCNK
jgi:hypothetical protein